MKDFFLTLSGILYGLITVMHLARFFLKWPVTVGAVTISHTVSLWAALIFLLLSIGCFVATRKK